MGSDLRWLVEGMTTLETLRSAPSRHLPAVVVAVTNTAQRSETVIPVNVRHRVKFAAAVSATVGAAHSISVVSIGALGGGAVLYFHDA
jgi:hypothetical protein